MNFYKHYLRLVHSEFNRNLLIVFSSSAVGAILPILFTPILTRIYSPAEFGYLALYNSIINVLIHLATGKYELAIFLPKKEGDIISLVIIVFLLSFVVATSFLFSEFFFDYDFIFILLSSIGIFATAAFATICNYYIKGKKYKLFLRQNIAKSIICIIVQIGLGYYFHNKYGLIIGYATGFLVFFLFFFIIEFNSIKSFFLGKPIVKLIANLKAYKKFPKFTVLSQFVNALANQLPVFVFQYFFGLNTAGFYSQALRNVDVPNQLISNSISQVFRQKFSDDYFNNVNCLPLLYSTIKKLFIIGIIPCLLILLFGDKIFAFVFGQKWEIAGEYAQILSIMLFLRFIANPISYSLYVLGKNNIDLIWQICLLILITSSLCMGYYIDGTVKLMLKFMTAFYGMMYLTNMYIVIKLVKKNVR